jgi:hypothetical protein
LSSRKKGHAKACPFFCSVADSADVAKRGTKMVPRQPAGGQRYDFAGLKSSDAEFMQ